LTRSCAWLGAALLAIGCRYVVSFDDFAGGSQSLGDGGRGTSSGGSGGSAGSAGVGTGGNDGDGSAGAPIDAPPDHPPPKPVTIYTPPPGATIRGITVDAKYIYWAEWEPGRGIFRMLKAGGPVVLMHLASLHAYDVAVDGTYLYWSDDDYHVWAMPIDGNPMSTQMMWFPHNSMFPRYITVDDNHVVYVTISTNTDGGNNLGDVESGSPARNDDQFSMQAGITGIAFPGVPDAGPRHVIWGHSTGIRDGQLDGTGKFNNLYMAGVQDPVAGVASDGTDLFWISNNQIIKKVGIATAQEPKDTGCISPPQDLGLYADIAVDDKWIYFTWPKKNEIGKCPRY
jgi:hypothetical protein